MKSQHGTLEEVTLLAAGKREGTGRQALGRNVSLQPALANQLVESLPLPKAAADAVEMHDLDRPGGRQDFYKVVGQAVFEAADDFGLGSIAHDANGIIRDMRIIE